MPKPLCACGDRATATWLGNPICALCFDAATRRETGEVAALLDYLVADRPARPHNDDVLPLDQGR